MCAILGSAVMELQSPGCICRSAFAEERLLKLCLHPINVPQHDGAAASTQQDDHQEGATPGEIPPPSESSELQGEALTSPKPEGNNENLATSGNDEEKTLPSGETIASRGREVILQGFNWESHTGAWWVHLSEAIPRLAAMGFTSIWLPPSSESFAPEGYLPRDFYALNSAYGTESELRSLLQKMKEHGVHAIADIVINHRIGSTQGVGGIYNRYDGMSLPWDEHAVTSDTGGLGNPSTGVIFEGVPNIDHTQKFVRDDLKGWLRWLIKDVGYDSFRFDYAKGYSPGYVKGYIEASNPQFSVGEYWDSCSYLGPEFVLNPDQDSHRQRIVDWIDGTGGLASAFDFTTKAILQEAVAKEEWWRLRDSKGRPSGVLGMWPSRAVTFVDNHDTGSTQAHWPFPSEHVIQGYAYILTHPGQPTVFYDHIFLWGDEICTAIGNLISVRRRCDIHNRSPVVIYEANAELYAAAIGGNLCMKLGEGSWSPGAEWKLATSGENYAVWEK